MNESVNRKRKRLRSPCSNQRNGSTTTVNARAAASHALDRRLLESPPPAPALHSQKLEGTPGEEETEREAETEEAGGGTEEKAESKWDRNRRKTRCGRGGTLVSAELVVRGSRTLPLCVSLSLSLSFSLCVCVCVCVCVRERERKRERVCVTEREESLERVTD